MNRASWDMFLGAITSRKGSPSGVLSLSTVVVVVVGAEVPLRDKVGAGGAAVLLLFFTGLLEADLVCTMTSVCVGCLVSLPSAVLSTLRDRQIDASRRVADAFHFDGYCVYWLTTFVGAV